jgi:prephenate dehydrogenase
MFMNDFQRITIIGLGLMGGSLAMALRERNICTITGFDLSEEALEEAMKRQLIDKKAASLEQAAAEAQLVVLATPVGTYRSMCQKMASVLNPGTVVTDLGSVKSPAMAAAETLPDHCYFVGGHPLAGSEKGGLAAASPYLFENAYYFLTPSDRTPETVTNQLKTWISTLGAFPVIVNAKDHDRILAKTSHFPHAMASLLATVVADEADESMTAFTGSGFRDTTRIASGNPELWEEIFHLNKQELIRCLHQLEIKAKRMRDALSEGDRRWIHDFLKAGKAFRDNLPLAGKDYLPAWYELYVDIKDQPGALAAITGVLAQAGVNIREIEILHAREGDQGAVRLAFTSIDEEQAAMKALSGKGHSFARSRGEKNHVDNESSC